jgi:hypothetical protein
MQWSLIYEQADIGSPATQTQKHHPECPFTLHVAECDLKLEYALAFFGERPFS